MDFTSTPWWLVYISMTVLLGVIWFVRRCVDSCDGCYLIRPTLRWPSWWMLSDSSDVVMTAVNVWPSWLVVLEDPSKVCNLLRYFLRWSDFPIGPYLSFADIFFRRTFAMERPILILDRLLDDEQYLTRWSNVTVHYSLVRCIIQYVRW